LPDGEGQAQASIGPIQVPDYLRPVYANYALVNSTPWDFRMVFALVRTPLPDLRAPDEAPLEVNPDAVAEIIIPANLIAPFLTALKNNFDGYIRLYGPPGLEPGQPGQGEG
jgi:hypothetical protein